MTKSSIKSVTKKESQEMLFISSFGVIFFVNLVVIYLAHQWFPSFLVLGTMSLSSYWALFLVSSFIAMAATLALPLFHEWEAQRKSQLSTTEWMAGYFILNFVTVWLLTRVAEVFGMGVSSIVVVGVLALVLDFVQGMAMMGLNNQQKN